MAFESIYSFWTFDFQNPILAITVNFLIWSCIENLICLVNYHSFFHNFLVLWAHKIFHLTTLQYH